MDIGDSDFASVTLPVTGGYSGYKKELRLTVSKRIAPLLPLLEKRGLVSSADGTPSVRSWPAACLSDLLTIRVKITNAPLSPCNSLGNPRRSKVRWQLTGYAGYICWCRRRQSSATATTLYSDD